MSVQYVCRRTLLKRLHSDHLAAYGRRPCMPYAMMGRSCSPRKERSRLSDFASRIGALRPVALA